MIVILFRCGEWRFERCQAAIKYVYCYLSPKSVNTDNQKSPLRLVKPVTHENTNSHINHFRHAQFTLLQRGDVPAATRKSHL